MIEPDEAILMVDFKYASNNERTYELALRFGDMFLTDAVERELIEADNGRWTREFDAPVCVLRALADLKWATWAMLQDALSTLDLDFRKYGLWKYLRARNLFHPPDWSTWLRLL